MSKYVDLLLVQPENSAPVLVEAPTSTAAEGDIVFFTQEDYGTVIRSEWVAPESAIYSMIRDVAAIYPALKVYSCRCKWEKAEMTEEVAENADPGLL